MKRTIRLRSLHPSPGDEIINTPEVMYNVASAELTSPNLEFLYITRDDVDYYRESLKPRYGMMKKLKGTRQWHYLEVGVNKTLTTKRYAFSTSSETYEPIEAPSPYYEGMETDNEDNQIVEPIIGEFYAIALRRTYQIGRATDLDPKNGTARFLMMRKAGPGGMSLSWPESEKLQDTELSKVIMKVTPPRYVQDKKTYRLSNDDIAAIGMSLL